MTTYSILNFIHVASSIAIIVATALERIMLMNLMKTSYHEQFRIWKDLQSLPLKIGLPALVTSFLTGIYLAITMWPQSPWVWPSIIAVFLVALATITSPSSSRKAANMEQELTAVWGKLWFSLQLRIGLLMGILFIMVIKPTLGESVASLVLWTLVAMAPMPYFKRKYNPLKST